MRKLTINRKKKIVACAMKVYVYLETRVDEDIVLDGIPCKKIDFLKNGKSITFDIPKQAINVFVVYDKFSPTKYKCKYLIPEGTEDVLLFTSARYGLFNGNHFELYR